MNVGRPFQEISRAGRWSRVEQPSHNPGRIQAEGEHGLASHLCTTWPPGCATCDRLSRLVPNFAQPQPCWPLSTQGPHATLLDGESPWWCCGISLRYAWRRHLVRTASAARMAQHAREAHRERGSLGAGRGPASLEETPALRIPTTPWTLCGFSSCGYQELGAWGPCGWWLADPLPLVPSACHPDQQVTGVEPGPPACKSPTAIRGGFPSCSNRRPRAA